MSRYVRISEDAARAALEALQKLPAGSGTRHSTRACDEFQRALRSLPSNSYGVLEDRIHHDLPGGRAAESVRVPAFPKPQKKPSRKAELARGRRLLVRHNATVKRNRKAEKNAETARIREAVWRRADGNCEGWVIARTSFPVRCPSVATEMHHIFGRIRVKQSEDNCAALCRACHRACGGNKPSARAWWEWWSAWFLERGNLNNAWKCDDILAGRIKVREAEKAREAGA
jgi:5-methylcytosine-specific restriction endonuclease McrA